MMNVGLDIWIAALVFAVAAGLAFLAVGWVARRARQRSREIHSQITDLYARLAAREAAVDDKISRAHERIQLQEQQLASDREQTGDRSAELEARIRRLEGHRLDQRLQGVEHQIELADKQREISRAAAAVNLARAEGSLSDETAAALLRHLAELGQDLEGAPADSDSDEVEP
jgi:hypothetical protein